MNILLNVKTNWKKMNIENSTILILGGWGLVGSAISRKIIEHKPKKIVISSLKKIEAEEAVQDLKSEFGNKGIEFVADWGNVFTRTEWKDEPYGKLLSDSETRMQIIQDTFSELTEKIKQESFLYSMLNHHKPDLVIDCINTATGIAYLDIYNSSLSVIEDFNNDKMSKENIEKLMSSTYIPQLIRHIQLLGEGFEAADTDTYIKVGTSGTGGMGLNIPYTHSEERPSRVLMSKTAVAGAQSLLMYLMARTPGKTKVKEIKPTATIAWKKIAFGEIKKGGKAVSLFDQLPTNAKKVSNTFDFSDDTDVQDTGNVLKSVYIDTGENGIFSKGEFETISSLGQMEIVTPEEIADLLVFEATGGNTGKDVIQGLDAFTMGPSYRGGYLRNRAIEELTELESKHSEAVAFELLGPPRLSKLLFEAHILKLLFENFENIIATSAEEISQKANELLSANSSLRQQILSIGLPILLNDTDYLRGKLVKIPVNRPGTNLEMSKENVNKWCYDGWVDIRKENFEEWKERLTQIMEEAKSIKGDISGSRHYYTTLHWKEFDKIDEGKIAAWIFEKQDKGWRFKR
ncbi:short-chain dehydrogenase [Candidatus Kapabacteria bacterium]|nr:short-chain dehydrogenase [Candidatus Kapabacteria bacterium]